MPAQARPSEEARPGAVIGMIGPGGADVPYGHDRYLVADDETALAAIARILAPLPAEAEGVVYVEVADSAERQSMCCSAQIDIRWIERNRQSPHDVG